MDEDERPGAVLDLLELPLDSWVDVGPLQGRQEEALAAGPAASHELVLIHFEPLLVDLPRLHAQALPEKGVDVLERAAAVHEALDVVGVEGADGLEDVGVHFLMLQHLDGL